MRRSLLTRRIGGEEREIEVGGSFGGLGLDQMEVSTDSWAVDSDGGRT